MSAEQNLPVTSFLTGSVTPAMASFMARVTVPDIDDGLPAAADSWVASAPPEAVAALRRHRKLGGIVAEFAVDFCALPIDAPSEMVEALMGDVLQRHNELAYIDRVHAERGMHVFLNSPPWVQVASDSVPKV